MILVFNTEAEAQTALEQIEAFGRGVYETLGYEVEDDVNVVTKDRHGRSHSTNLRCGKWADVQATSDGRFWIPSPAPRGHGADKLVAQEGWDESADWSLTELEGGD